MPSSDPMHPHNRARLSTRREVEPYRKGPSAIPHHAKPSVRRTKYTASVASRRSHAIIRHLRHVMEGDNTRGQTCVAQTHPHHPSARNYLRHAGCTFAWRTTHNVYNKQRRAQALCVLQRTNVMRAVSIERWAGDRICLCLNDRCDSRAGCLPLSWLPIEGSDCT